jgi:putative pyruvate formate lyase activating enzyme
MRTISLVLRRHTALPPLLQPRGQQQHTGISISQRPGRRALHLAPPFLLDDDHRPRHTTLSARDAARKRAQAYAHLRECNLCPRRCGVNRYEATGVCLIGDGDKVKVNVIAPHFGEEPCVQGHHGSGAVFFSMCNLRCVFCQNHDIAHRRNGMDLSPEDLGDW